jgi:hypothetical protein
LPDSPTLKLRQDGKNQSIVCRDNDPYLAIDNSHMSGSGSTSEKARDLVSTWQTGAGAHTCGLFVGCEHDFWVEKFDERSYVIVSSRLQERFRQLTMPGNRSRVRLRFSPHASPGAARKLADCFGRSIDQGRYFGERQVEDVMQNESDSL